LSTTTTNPHIDIQTGIIKTSYKNKFFQIWFYNSIIWVKQILKLDGQLNDYPEFMRTTHCAILLLGEHNNTPTCGRFCFVFLIQLEGILCF
jgi:hypothetical protein